MQRGARLDAAEIGDLQEALNRLPEQGGVVHLPAGIYDIERTVVCTLKQGQHLDLTGDGRATVIRFTAGGGRPLLDLRGGGKQLVAGPQNHHPRPHLRGHTRMRGRAPPEVAECRAPAPGSLLHPLFIHLGELPAEIARVTLASRDCKRILGASLPDSAWEKNSWWTNDPANSRARAWLAAGWIVIVTKRIEGGIVFARLPERPSVR